MSLITAMDGQDMYMEAGGQRSVTWHACASILRGKGDCPLRVCYWGRVFKITTIFCYVLACFTFFFFLSFLFGGYSSTDHRRACRWWACGFTRKDKVSKHVTKKWERSLPSVLIKQLRLRLVYTDCMKKKLEMIYCLICNEVEQHRNTRMFVLDRKDQFSCLAWRNCVIPHSMNHHTTCDDGRNLRPVATSCALNSTQLLSRKMPKFLNPW